MVLIKRRIRKVTVCSYLAPVVYCEWCPLLPDTEDSLSNSDLLAPKSTVVSATDLNREFDISNIFPEIPYLRSYSVPDFDVL